MGKRTQSIFMSFEEFYTKFNHETTEDHLGYLNARLNLDLIGYCVGYSNTLTLLNLRYFDNG